MGESGNVVRYVLERGYRGRVGGRRGLESEGQFCSGGIDEGEERDKVGAEGDEGRGAVGVGGDMEGLEGGLAGSVCDSQRL